MSCEIAVNEVLAFAVASDEAAFRMSVRGQTGDVVGLAFTTGAVKTLMLSLSRVADAAFKRMFQDDSARLIHPVESFSLQPAPETDQPILIIRTSDDFEVAPAIEPEVHNRFVQRASDLTRRFAGPARADQLTRSTITLDPLASCYLSASTIPAERPG